MVSTADIRDSRHLDRLLVVPRHRGEFHAWQRLLTEALPGVLIRRTAEGLTVPGLDAGRLLDVHGYDLRWTEDARRYAENRRWICSIFASATERIADIKRGGVEAARIELCREHGLDVLDDHQLINVAAMTTDPGFGLCVFDEQGAGKTVTTIFAFDVLAARDQVDFLLIVAPKSMVSEWPEDFRRFTGDLYRVGQLTGPRRGRLKVIAAGPDVIVTNFESALAMESELRALLRRFGRRAVLVVDESFHIKNRDAGRTGAIRRLREWCGRAYVLCGTPAPNSPTDLVQQFDLVDFGMTFSGMVLPDDRVEARPVVREAIQSRGAYVRSLKSVVLPDLPDKTFNRVLLDMAPVQRNLYLTALQDLAADLQSVDDLQFRRELTTYLQRHSALLQLCSSPSSVVDGYNELPTKLAALDELLEELIANRGEKVVLWSFYSASICAIVDRYARFSPVRYDGTVTDTQSRRRAVRDFQEDDRTMLFVANPAAAGAGLTLHRARVAVYESMSNQAAHYLQSLDRVHRRGQTRDVEYLVLLCRGSIELQEYDRLLEKERAAQDLLGDEATNPLSRQGMLAELLDSLSLLDGASGVNDAS